MEDTLCHRGSAAGTPITENGKSTCRMAGTNLLAATWTSGYDQEYEKTGNYLCVSTATVKNRSDGSGTWKITISKKSPWCRTNQSNN
ncbi:MAG: hypothetical protein IPI22_15125 [Bacteroidetes bacterium]|nr:hypothetical protein [Bacteroidota bacterium]